MVASFRSVAHAAATGGSDPVVAVPAGTQNGDLLLAFCAAATGGTVWTPPGAFTAHPNSLGGQVPLFRRIASSEPANYTFAQSGIGNGCVTLVCITGVATSTPDEVAAGAAVGSGDIVIPSLNSGGAGRLLMQMVQRTGGGGTFTPPGTAAERWDTVVAPTTFTSAGGDETVGAGATGTRTWVPSSSGGAAGYSISVVPAPPSAGTFTGGYAFDGSGFLGEINPEATFGGGYDFTGSDFVGVAGAAPTEVDLFPGGRDRFTARRTPKNRRRSR